MSKQRAKRSVKVWVLGRTTPENPFVIHHWGCPCQISETPIDVYDKEEEARVYERGNHIVLPALLTYTLPQVQNHL